MTARKVSGRWFPRKLSPAEREAIVFGCKGMTQMAIAAKYGIHISMVEYLKKGKRRLDDYTPRPFSNLLPRVDPTCEHRQAKAALNFLAVATPLLRSFMRQHYELETNRDIRTALDVPSEQELQQRRQTARGARHARRQAEKNRRLHPQPAGPATLPRQEQDRRWLDDGPVLSGRSE